VLSAPRSFVPGGNWIATVPGSTPGSTLRIAGGEMGCGEGAVLDVGCAGGVDCSACACALEVVSIRAMREMGRLMKST
jgi:hypothetical protein